jgi:DNA-binding response OmpR family regulator
LGHKPKNKVMDNLQCINVNDGRIVIRPDSYSEMHSVQLTATSAEVLKVLMDNPDKLISFEDLIKKIWGRTKEYNTSTIRLLDVYLTTVRGFLNDCEADCEIVRFKGKYIYFKTKEINTPLN